MFSMLIPISVVLAIAPALGAFAAAMEGYSNKWGGTIAAAPLFAMVGLGWLMATLGFTTGSACLPVMLSAMLVAACSPRVLQRGAGGRPPAMPDRDCIVKFVVLSLLMSLAMAAVGASIEADLGWHAMPTSRPPEGYYTPYMLRALPTGAAFSLLHAWGLIAVYRRLAPRADQQEAPLPLSHGA